MRLFKQQTGISRRAAAFNIKQPAPIFPKKNRVYEKMNSL